MTMFSKIYLKAKVNILIRNIYCLPNKQKTLSYLLDFSDNRTDLRQLNVSYFCEFLTITVNMEKHIYKY